MVDQKRLMKKSSKFGLNSRMINHIGRMRSQIMVIQNDQSKSQLFSAFDRLLVIFGQIQVNLSQFKRVIQVKQVNQSQSITHLSMEHQLSFNGTKGQVIIHNHSINAERPQTKPKSKPHSIDYSLKSESLDEIINQTHAKDRKNEEGNRNITASQSEIANSQKQLLIQLMISTVAKQLEAQKTLQRSSKARDLPTAELPEEIVQSEQQRQINKANEYLSYLARIESIQLLLNKAAARKSFRDQLKSQILQEKQNLKADIIHEKLEIEKLEAQINTKSIVEKERQKQMAEVFELKKRNNNLLQESKGNVRVYCRLRPCPLKAEQADYQVMQNLIKIKKDKKDLKSSNLTSEFEYLFEKVFDENATQNDLFEELVELVKCSVDGKNVCIFAYGQTGSGKTFTMKGELQKERWDQRGFIPRSIEYIFSQVKTARAMGYSCRIQISVSEIYNDKHFDLLKKDQNKSRSGSSSKKKQFSSERPSLDLVYIQVGNVNQALLLLKQALSLRSTANTNMNIESSRSHLIFEIRNEFANQEMKIHRRSSLVLVDLAGSQRQKDSGVTGARFEEAKEINKSLTELGKVMRAIKDRENPSFRSSRLTTVLQRHLEGDSKAVMFVNVSTEKKDLDQTLNSLGFAESVKLCQLKPTKSSSSLSL